MRPYDHLPFQWSVHVQREPGAEPEHHEFLAMDGSDPRLRVHRFALRCAGRKRQHRRVQRGIRVAAASELAAWLPEFAERIKKIQARLWDLLPVVRNHVYHPAFAGSFSLKAVLPALVPEMTYEGMEVANGQDAGLAWESLVRGALDQTERDNIRKALLEYCGQDTLAMVKLLEKLQSTCG